MYISYMDNRLTKIENMKPRISMITLGVDNLEASVDFYKNVLGFPQLESQPTVAFFTLNGTWLGLYNKKALAEDANVPHEGGGFSGISLSHNVQSEEEVIAVLKMVEEKGGTIVKSPQKVFWGGFHGYFKDIDGYLWEVAHNPFMWVGPEDT